MARGSTPACGEFGRVADEPGLDPARIGLDVKLQAERRRPDPERLDRTQRGRGEPLGAGGRSQLSPCQCSTGTSFEARERRSAAGLGQLDRRIADLLGRPGRDARRQAPPSSIARRGTRQGSALPIETAADRRDLVDEERVGLRLDRRRSARRARSGDPRTARPRPQGRRRPPRHRRAHSLLRRGRRARLRRPQRRRGGLRRRSSTSAFAVRAPRVRPAAHRPIG